MSQKVKCKEMRSEEELFFFHTWLNRRSQKSILQARTFLPLLLESRQRTCWLPHTNFTGKLKKECDWLHFILLFFLLFSIWNGSGKWNRRFWLTDKKRRTVIRYIFLLKVNNVSYFRVTHVTNIYASNLL